MLPLAIPLTGKALTERQPGYFTQTSELCKTLGGLRKNVRWLPLPLVHQPEEQGAAAPKRWCTAFSVKKENIKLSKTAIMEQLKCCSVELLQRASN